MIPDVQGKDIACRRPQDPHLLIRLIHSSIFPSSTSSGSGPDAAAAAPKPPLKAPPIAAQKPASKPSDREEELVIE